MKLNIRNKGILFIVVFALVLQTFPVFAAESGTSESGTSEEGTAQQEAITVIAEDDPTYAKIQAQQQAQSSARLRSSATLTVSAANLNYDHADRFQTGYNIYNGIDVSYANGGSINWNKVKAAGVDFAIIRVGARGYGDAGNMIEDTCYKKNIEGALDAGIKVGVYIFSQATTTAEAKEEANYILSRIKSYGTSKITLPVVMDYEYSPTSTSGRLYKAGLSKTQATNICMTFCDTVKAAGYTPMVYANKSMLTSSLNASTISAKYPIWLAQYNTQATYTGDYDMWQYSSTGTVNGISGNVDLNFWYDPITSDISKANTNTISSQSYTGKAITPAVTVRMGIKTLTKNKDYTVSYSGNKNVGTAKVTIKGIGDYTGTKTITFKIISSKPAAVTGFKKSSSGLTSIKLAWSKVSNAKGYQIYRSKAPNGTYKKVKTITSNSTTSWNNTGLSRNREYYYKIRAYNVSGTTTNYSAFSSMVKAYVSRSYSITLTAKYASNVRANAGTSYGKVVTVPKNAKMSGYCYTYDKSGTKWFRIKYVKSKKTYKGYIKASLVSVKYTGKVTCSALNVRKGAGTKYGKKATIYKNQSVTVKKVVTNSSGRWYYISYVRSGKTYTGYVSGSYIR